MELYLHDMDTIICKEADVRQFKLTRAVRAPRCTEAECIREFPRTADGSALARTLASLHANQPWSDETALGQSLRVFPLLSPLKQRFAVVEWSREALTYWLLRCAASVVRCFVTHLLAYTLD